MSGAHGGASVEAIAAGDSLVHRLEPRAKIIGLIGLVLVSVSTPDGAWIAFGAYATVLLVLVGAARLRPAYVLRRMLIEVPFLVAAALLPLLVPDGRTRGGTLAAKVTIGVLAMVVLSSTTPFPRLLQGFERLRAPRLIVLVVGFMWRYLHVIGDEVARMRLAQRARGYEPRWLWQAGAVARTVGTLFVRSLERGERVYLAMVSRGYAGTLPATLLARSRFGPPDAVFAAGLLAVLATARLGAA